MIAKSLKKLTATLVAMTVITAGTALYNEATANHHSSEKTSYGDKSKKTIVETAVAADNFTTLVAAVKAAGLVETLSSDGKFTVFAPTDDAFNQLPEGALQNLLDNPDELKKVLLYHVVEGKVKAKDVVKLDSAKTVGGEKVKIKAYDGVVKVNDAKVLKTDVMASNGVIHVIDKVLLPGGNDASIAEVATEAGQFNTLLTALGEAGLAETFANNEGPFTVFAPTDEAFAKLPEGTIPALLADKQRLAEVLKYHVVAGNVSSKEVVKLDNATTLQGTNVDIKVVDGVVYVDDAKVIKTDVTASNGVIHVNDSVIIPN